MRRALAALALPLLLAAPPAAAGGLSEVDQACVDPAGLVACIEASVEGTFTCVPHAADRVSCWANATWAYRGWTQLPGVVAGDVTRAGGLNVDWCEPTGLCRGVGVGLLLVDCTYLPGQPCGDTFSHSLWLGTPRIAPGACIDFTFSPWVQAWGDIHPRRASEVASIVVNGHDGPLLEVAAHPSTTETVCN